MLDHLGGHHWDLDDLPGLMHPAPGEGSAAVGTLLQAVRLPAGRSGSTTGKAFGPGLASCLAFFLAGGGRLVAGHRGRVPTRQTALQVSNALPELVDGRLLLGDDRQQFFPASPREVLLCVHNAASCPASIAQSAAITQLVYPLLNRYAFPLPLTPGHGPCYPSAAD